MSSAVTQVVQAAAVLFVASHVSPGRYALWGLASILFNLQHLVAAFGFAPALVQSSESEDAWSTAYQSAVSVTFVMTVAVCLGLVVSAPFVSHIRSLELRDSDVLHVFWLMSAVLAAQALVQVPQAVLERRFMFRERATAEAVGTAGYLATVVVSLLLGAGVWSLVVAKAVQTLSTLALTLLALPGVPRVPRVFEARSVARLSKFGAAIGVGGLISLLFTNVDTLLVGSFHGSDSLGSYALAFSLATMIPTMLTTVVGKVYFSQLASSRFDEQGFREASGDLLHIVTALMIPLTACLVMFGPGLVDQLFGQRWSEAGDMLRWLALYGLLRTVSLVANCLLSSVGRSRPLLAGEIISLAVAIPVAALTRHLGPANVAAAFAFGQLVGTCFAFVVASSLLLPVLNKTRTVFTALAIAIVPAALFAVLDLPIIGTAAMAVTYVAAISLVDRHIWRLFTASDRDPSGDQDENDAGLGQPATKLAASAASDVSDGSEVV